MVIKKPLLCALILVFFGGCVTTASREAQLDNAFSVSGYTDIKLDEGTYRMSFWGESVTTSAASADFARYQSARLAANDGYEYFMISRYFVTPPISEEPAPAGTAADNNPTAPLDLPTNTLIIECFKERPVNASGAVYNAAAISKRIRSEYRVK